MATAARDPERQGQLLRKALDDHVRSAITTGAVRRHLKHRYIDIDDLIKQYVPEQSTFDYAENVLRSAGFDVGHRPAADVPHRFAGTEHEFDVEAYLGFGREHFVGGRCVIVLRPKNPYDYSQVHRIFAMCDFLCDFLSL
jgi:hypothetical protein